MNFQIGKSEKFTGGFYTAISRAVDYDNLTLSGDNTFERYQKACDRVKQ